MQKRKTKLNSLYIVVVAVFLALATFLLSFNIRPSLEVSADITYTTVIEDLGKDETFKIEDYPVIENDYSLQVIQIAESVNNELFVYVYQPAKLSKLNATSISFSTAINDNFYPQLYNLELISQEETISKYLVKDFKAKEDVVRYYDFVSIFRKWDETVDDPPIEGQIISEKSYEIGKLWTVCTYQGDVYYSWEEVETIDITDKLVGFVRYNNGYAGIPGMGVPPLAYPGFDSHFVAFSSSKSIERLMSASVYYESQSYSYSVGKETFGEVEKGKIADINYTESVSAEIPTGPHKKKYSFDRIQSVSDFIKTEDREYVYDYGLFNITEQSKITDENLKKLENMEWVLRFVETEYSSGVSSVGSFHYRYVNKSIVSNVSILRLTYETDGKVYNLGVVDNKQSGSKDPINETTSKFQWAWWVKLLFWLTIVIVGVILLATFLPAILMFILKAVFTVIKLVFKIIWFLISWPFKLIKRKKEEK